jgi:hypothetical protein
MDSFTKGTDGACDGYSVGSGVMKRDGCDVGLLLAFVGDIVGISDGIDEEGLLDGSVVGELVGSIVGSIVGEIVGSGVTDKIIYHLDTTSGEET